VIASTDFKFFIDVASYAHASWFPAIPQTVTAHAMGSVPARQLLSRWLIRGQALEVPGKLTLDDNERWLLAGRDRVAEMARSLGLKLVAPVIRVLVSRKDVEKIRAAFGDDGYAASLELAGLSEKRIGRGWLDRASSIDEIREGVSVLGHALLSQQLQADERQLKARLRLMFPREWPAHMADDLPEMAAPVGEWLRCQNLAQVEGVTPNAQTADALSTSQDRGH
jgi:hypothetical protein